MVKQETKIEEFMKIDTALKNLNNQIQITVDNNQNIFDCQFKTIYCCNLFLNKIIHELKNEKQGYLNNCIRNIFLIFQKLIKQANNKILYNEQHFQNYNKKQKTQVQSIKQKNQKLCIGNQKTSSIQINKPNPVSLDKNKQSNFFSLKENYNVVFNIKDSKLSFEEQFRIEKSRQQKKADEIFEEIEQGNFQNYNNQKNPYIMILLNEKISNSILKDLIFSNSQIENWVEQYEKQKTDRNGHKKVANTLKNISTQFNKQLQIQENHQDTKNIDETKDQLNFQNLVNKQTQIILKILQQKQQINKSRNMINNDSNATQNEQQKNDIQNCLSEQQQIKSNILTQDFGIEYQNSYLKKQLTLLTQGDLNEGNEQRISYLQNVIDKQDYTLQQNEQQIQQMKEEIQLQHIKIVQLERAKTFLLQENKNLKRDVLYKQSQFSEESQKTKQNNEQFFYTDSNYENSLIYKGPSPVNIQNEIQSQIQEYNPNDKIKDKRPLQYMKKIQEQIYIQTSPGSQKKIRQSYAEKEDTKIDKSKQNVIKNQKIKDNIILRYSNKQSPIQYFQDKNSQNLSYTNKQTKNIIAESQKIFQLGQVNIFTNQKKQLQRKIQQNYVKIVQNLQIKKFQKLKKPTIQKCFQRLIQKRLKNRTYDQQLLRDKNFEISKVNQEYQKKEFQDSCIRNKKEQQNFQILVNYQIATLKTQTVKNKKKKFYSKNQQTVYQFLRLKGKQSKQRQHSCFNLSYFYVLNYKKTKKNYYIQPIQIAIQSQYSQNYSQNFSFEQEMQYNLPQTLNEQPHVQNSTSHNKKKQTQMKKFIKQQNFAIKTQNEQVQYYHQQHTNSFQFQQNDFKKSSVNLKFIKTKKKEIQKDTKSIDQNLLDYFFQTQAKKPIQNRPLSVYFKVNNQFVKLQKNFLPQIIGQELNLYKLDKFTNKKRENEIRSYKSTNIINTVYTQLEQQINKIGQSKICSESFNNQIQKQRVIKIFTQLSNYMNSESKKFIINLINAFFKKHQKCIKVLNHCEKLITIIEDFTKSQSQLHFQNLSMNLDKISSQINQILKNLYSNINKLNLLKNLIIINFF